MLTCTRCGKSRKEKYIVMRKSKWTGKTRPRCRAKSTCASRKKRRDNASRK